MGNLIGAGSLKNARLPREAEQKLEEVKEKRNPKRVCTSPLGAVSLMCYVIW